MVTKRSSFLGLATLSGVLDQRGLHDADQGLPSGVIASPSMPLLAVRPLVLQGDFVASDRLQVSRRGDREA